MGWIFFVINIIAHWKIFLQKTQITYGDLNGFPETISQGFVEFFYVWKNITLGMYRSPGYIFSAIQSIILFFTINPVIAQKVYMFSLPLISFFSLKYLLEHTIKIKNKFAIFIACLFYAYCPISLQEAVGGTYYSSMLVFAVLPVIYYLVFNLIEFPTFKKIFVLSLLVGIISSIYAQTPLIFLMTFITPLLTHLIYSKFKAMKNILNLFVVVILAFMFNPIHIISNYYLVTTRTSDGRLSSFGENLESLKAILPLTYKYSSLLNTLRMGTGAAKFLVYNETHYWTLLFLIIVFVVLLCNIWYFIKTRPVNRYLLYAFVSYLSIVLFIWLATKSFIINLFTKLPLLFIFRNPAKLTYMASFFFSIMFAFSLEFLIKKIKNIYIKYVLITITYIIVFVYLWFIWLGDKGLEGARDYYTIPKSFYEIVNLIKIDKKIGEGRSFWIPSSHETTSIKLAWLDRDKLEAQLGMTNFGNEYYEYNITSQLLTAIKKGDTNAFKNILKLTQIKYIPILKDQRYFENQMINYTDVQNILSEFEKINETDDYLLVKNNNIVNEVYSPEFIIKTNGRSYDYTIVASLADVDSNSGIIFSNQIPNIDIYEDKMFTFMSPLKVGTPFSNMVIDNNWIYPKIERKIENISIYLQKYKNAKREDGFFAYVERVCDNFVIISQLIDNSDPDDAEKSELINYYNSLLSELNVIIEQIPEDKINIEFLSIMRKPILYIDESFVVLQNKLTIPEELSDNYQKFKTIVVDLDKHLCDVDFCYTFGLSKEQTLDTKLYSEYISTKSANITLNDKQIDLFTKDEKNPSWLNLGSIKYNTGANILKIDFDKSKTNVINDPANKNFIEIPNIKTPKTYEISFIYHLKNDDTKLMLTESTTSRDFDIASQKVFITSLSKSHSNDFCEVIKNNKCYRKFLYYYNPVNDVRSLFVNFSKDFGDDFIIDEIKLSEYEVPILGFVTNREYKYNSPVIAYKKINPTKYKINISNVSSEYILVLNQSFHKNWKAKINNNIRKPIVDEKNHFIINGFANAWLIAPEDAVDKSDYEIILEFSSQKLYYINLFLMFSYFGVGLYILIKDYVIVKIKETKRK